MNDSNVLEKIENLMSELEIKSSGKFFVPVYKRMPNCFYARLFIRLRDIQPEASLCILICVESASSLQSEKEDTLLLYPLRDRDLCQFPLSATMSVDELDVTLTNLTKEALNKVFLGLGEDPKSYSFLKNGVIISSDLLKKAFIRSKYPQTLVQINL
ncbi:hypothetical protein ACHJH3_06635 [Campylobacter sp. MOP7]|uniref:hypothetical protein n=1 Tax=Campylobacter canis TaxID=3378588 RepID=UPI00387E6AF4